MSGNPLPRLLGTVVKMNPHNKFCILYFLVSSVWPSRGTARIREVWRYCVPRPADEVRKRASDKDAPSPPRESATDKPRSTPAKPNTTPRPKATSLVHHDTSKEREEPLRTTIKAGHTASVTTSAPPPLPPDSPPSLANPDRCHLPLGPCRHPMLPPLCSLRRPRTRRDGCARCARTPSSRGPSLSGTRRPSATKRHATSNIKGCNTTDDDPNSVTKEGQARRTATTTCFPPVPCSRHGTLTVITVGMPLDRAVS